LGTIHSNDPNFTGTDFAIDPNERGWRGIAGGRERSTQATLSGWGLTMNLYINTGNCLILTMLVIKRLLKKTQENNGDKLAN
jgi:hypothetical protein